MQLWWCHDGLRFKMQNRERRVLVSFADLRHHHQVIMWYIRIPYPPFHPRLHHPLSLFLPKIPALKAGNIFGIFILWMSMVNSDRLPSGESLVRCHLLHNKKLCITAFSRTLFYISYISVYDFVLMFLVRLMHA